MPSDPRPSTDPARVIAHLLAPDGGIPNHPRWPLLVYPGAVAIAGDDPAAAFEALFDRNRWPAAWRNGVFPFHHFHTSAHEALGIYSGEVTVQFGGDGGIAITARPGDVVVLPAGTGHKKLASRGSLGVVGAYPVGQHPDTNTPLLASARRAAEAVARVPLPDCDPVHGAGGPLFEYWRG
ncbi:MAG: cupin [Bacteroidota bacterium]